MPFALASAAAHGGFVALGLAAAFAVAAALTVFATVVLLALLHGGFHVLACATRLAIFHFAFVFAATRGVVIGIGCGVMAAAFAILHIGHVVMTAPLGLRGGCRVRRCRRRGCLLRPGNQRQGEDEDRSKQSEFHKSSLSNL